MYLHPVLNPFKTDTKPTNKLNFRKVGKYRFGPGRGFKTNSEPLILLVIYQFNEPLIVFKENAADHSGRDILINCRIKLGCYPLKRLHDRINNSIKYGSWGIFGSSINKLLLG